MGCSLNMASDSALKASCMVSSAEASGDLFLLVCSHRLPCCLPQLAGVSTCQSALCCEHVSGPLPDGLWQHMALAMGA